MLIKRLVCGAFLTFFAVSAAFAADGSETDKKDAAHFFATAPSTVVRFLDPTTRLDMIDWFEAGSDTESTNNTGGKCRVTAISPTSISFMSDRGLEYQLFVIYAPRDTVIGVIETLYAPYPDSTLRLYDCDWQPLLQKRGVNPRLADWLTPSGRKHRSLVEDELPYIIASYTWDDDTRSVIVENHTDSYFLPVERPEALDMLRPKLVYRWDGRKFKLSNK